MGKIGVQGGGDGKYRENSRRRDIYRCRMKSKRKCEGNTKNKVKVRKGKGRRGSEHLFSVFSFWSHYDWLAEVTWQNVRNLIG